MQTPFFILLSLLLLGAPAHAEDGFFENHGAYGEHRPCHGLSGQEKKHCIREVKKAHAERYREKRMERRGEIDQKIENKIER